MSNRQVRSAASEYAGLMADLRRYQRVADRRTRYELVDAAEAIELLAGLVDRAKPIVEADAQMAAAITRFAPFPEAEQAKHDSTESQSERWLAAYEEATRGAN